MPHHEFVPHDISLTNLVLGEARLFRLMLPEKWEITRGLAPPDMQARHMRGGAPWVASGRAWYVVYHSEKGWALELEVRVTAHEKKPPTGSQPIEIGLHTGYVAWRKRRRGLPWKRHDVYFMTIGWYCPQTERHIELEFSGWCPQEGFEAIRAGILRTICH